MGRPFSQHELPPPPPVVGVVPTALLSREPPPTASGPATAPAPADPVAALEFCERASGLSAPDDAFPAPDAAPVALGCWPVWQSLPVTVPPVGLSAGAFVITNEDAVTFDDTSSCVACVAFGGSSCSRKNRERRRIKRRSNWGPEEAAKDFLNCDRFLTPRGNRWQLGLIK